MITPTPTHRERTRGLVRTIAIEARAAVATMRALRPIDWLRIAAFIFAAGLAIAIPTRLIPNEFVRRMTPTRPQDYAFWAVGAILTGLVLGLPRAHVGRAQTAAVTGGVGTFLAVGCPVCNKLVVALLGVGGATSVFAPPTGHRCAVDRLARRSIALSAS